MKMSAAAQTVRRSFRLMLLQMMLNFAAVAGLYLLAKYELLAHIFLWVFIPVTALGLNIYFLIRRRTDGRELKAHFPNSNSIHIWQTASQVFGLGMVVLWAGAIAWLVYFVQKFG